MKGISTDDPDSTIVQGNEISPILRNPLTLSF